MYCKNCGQEIDEKAVICPHCGVAVKEDVNENDVKKSTNWFGVVGFVTSLISLFCGLEAGIVVAIIGLIFSSIGLGIRRKHSLNGFAVAGLVICIVVILLLACAITYADMGDYLY